MSGTIRQSFWQMTAIVVLAMRLVIRGDVVFRSGTLTSCSAPSPLMSVTCTTWPSAAESTGLTVPSIAPPTPG